MAASAASFAFVTCGRCVPRRERKSRHCCCVCYSAPILSFSAIIVWFSSSANATMGEFVIYRNRNRINSTFRVRIGCTRRIESFVRWTTPQSFSLLRCLIFPNKCTQGMFLEFVCYLIRFYYNDYFNFVKMLTFYFCVCPCRLRQRGAPLGTGNKAISFFLEKDELFVYFHTFSKFWVLNCC